MSHSRTPDNDMISRSELLEKIGTNSYRSIDPHDQRGKIFKMVAMFPAADAVAVIRCRDCKLWEQHKLFKEIGYCRSAFREKDGVCIPGSFFCADGRPKMDAEVEGC